MNQELTSESLLRAAEDIATRMAGQAPFDERDATKRLAWLRKELAATGVPDALPVPRVEPQP